jgi:hypothetical protein
MVIVLPTLQRNAPLPGLDGMPDLQVSAARGTNPWVIVVSYRGREISFMFILIKHLIKSYRAPCGSG